MLHHGKCFASCTTTNDVIIPHPYKSLFVGLELHYGMLKPTESRVSAVDVAAGILAFEINVTLHCEVVPQ